MGEAGGVHQISDTDAIEPAFAKNLGCLGDDPVMVLLLFFLCNPHAFALWQPVRIDGCDTLMITIIYIALDIG
ncbi:hypothetical protein [Agrobacterium tumefaciens]|uniref:hypothetical protein n=1 Tax=Agrobacterium tumefaciens TaxID=358 RepID=UPI0030136270